MGRAVLLALALLAPACAGSPPEAEARGAEDRLEGELVGLVERIYAALLAGDRAAWEAMFCEDFVLVDRDGAIKTRGELLAELEPLPPHIQLELRVDEPIARDLGDAAVLVYRTREHEVIFGQTLEVDYRNTMVFRRGAGGWRLSAWHYVEEPRDPAPIAVDPATLDALVGEYAADEQVRYRVERRGDQLFGGRIGGEATLLIPESEGVYAGAGSEFRKIFIRDGGGEVVEMLDRRKGTDLRWRRVR